MKKLYLLIYTIFSLFLFSQNLEIPFSTGRIIDKEHYSFEYSEKHEQAFWVAYELTKSEVLGSVKRKDTFKPDPSISTGSATLEDYKGSGYDRGHLAPAADMKMSPKSMSESFYMSNMSPQHPSFNRGIWSKLESIVRTWAIENESVYIVTGPVLTKDNYPTIGENRVSVPEFYYKVVLDYTGDDIKAIGFILPNEKTSNPIQDYAVTIDKVEEFTGIDFYPQLDDVIEEELESVIDIRLWSFVMYREVPERFKSNDIAKEKELILTVYWVNSSSNMRHNSACKYYNNTKNGYFTEDKTGKACSSCGG